MVEFKSLICCLLSICLSHFLFLSSFSIFWLNWLLFLRIPFCFFYWLVIYLTGRYTGLVICILNSQKLFRFSFVPLDNSQLTPNASHLSHSDLTVSWFHLSGFLSLVVLLSYFLFLINYKCCLAVIFYNFIVSCPKRKLQEEENSVLHIPT